jgi:hypothetical protein
MVRKSKNPEHVTMLGIFNWVDDLLSLPFIGTYF